MSRWKDMDLCMQTVGKAKFHPQRQLLIQDSFHMGKWRSFLTTPPKHLSVLKVRFVRTPQRLVVLVGGRLFSICCWCRGCGFFSGKHCMGVFGRRCSTSPWRRVSSSSCSSLTNRCNASQTAFGFHSRDCRQFASSAAGVCFPAISDGYRKMAGRIRIIDDS